MDDAAPVTTGSVEDALTTDRKGVRMPRVEVITRGERRRVWPLEQKREIVAESLGPELTPSEVARKYGISSGLLYNWRRQFLDEQMALARRPLPSFTQVATASVQTELTAQQPQTVMAQPLSSHSRGLIEIILPDGVKLRVDAAVEEKALRPVLAALSPR